MVGRSPSLIPTPPPGVTLNTSLYILETALPSNPHEKGLALTCQGPGHLKDFLTLRLSRPEQQPTLPFYTLRVFPLVFIEK